MRPGEQFAAVRAARASAAAAPPDPRVEAGASRGRAGADSRIGDAWKTSGIGESPSGARLASPAADTDRDGRGDTVRAKAASVRVDTARASNAVSARVPRADSDESYRGGFSGGPSSQAIGRWGRGEGADYSQQRYAGSYGLGRGGERGEEQGESFGSKLGRFFGKGPEGLSTFRRAHQGRAQRSARRARRHRCLRDHGHGDVRRSHARRHRPRPLDEADGRGRRRRHRRVSSRSTTACASSRATVPKRRGPRRKILPERRPRPA